MTIENIEKFVWNDQIRFMERGSRAIVANFNSGVFIKIRKDALDVLNKASARGVTKTIAHLPISEQKGFKALLNALLQQKYIVKDANQKSKPIPIKHIPKRAYYETSADCNLKCAFCYANPKVNRIPYTGNTEHTYRIFDQMVQLNIAYLIFSGGEPFLRKDLIDLIRYARKQFPFVCMTTNGTMLGKKEADALKDSGINYVQISLESDDPARHDHLRGKGNFDKSIKAVQYLKDAGFKENEVIISATLSNFSVKQLTGFNDFAASLGVKSSFSYYQPVGRGAKNKDDYFLFNRDLFLFYFNIFKTKHYLSSGVNECADLQGVEPSRRIVPSIRSFCGIGAKTLAIKEHGDIVPCHLFLSSKSFIMANVFDPDVWDKLNAYYKALTGVDDIDECKDCDIRYFCGNGCAAHVYWQHGTFKKKNPYCSFFKDYLSALVWNLGEENEFQKIYDDLVTKMQQYQARTAA